jgi:tetratricopeptide (TPR) repeat protein
MQKRLLGIVICVALVGIFLLVWLSRGQNDFDHWMTVGAGYLEKSEGTNAINAYSKAASLAPESIAVHLNLANAYLLAESNQDALAQCQQVINLDHNNAAAYYLMGCAYLHLNQATQAVEAFQQSQKIDPAVTALNFQLGLAQERLGNLDDAMHEFETVVQFEPEHPSAHYQLSRLYQRAGRDAEAAQELAKHQQIQGKGAGPAPGGALAFERCKYTQPIISFALEQPDRHGIPVHFVQATAEAFGPSRYHGPVGVIDYNHDGRNSLFAMEGNAFRLLDNNKGKFTPLGESLPASNATYRCCLVGDLNNDRYEDVVVLGEQASHVFRFATNGQFREVTVASGLKNVKASDGLLADLDFTGKLDLLAVLPGGEGLRVFRNLGNGYFMDSTTNSGLPGNLPGAQHVAVEDWNNEDVPGVFVTRSGKPALFFSKQRAGQFVETNATANWPVGNVIAVGDLNNDLLLDCVVADDNLVQVIFGGSKQPIKLEAKGLGTKGVLLMDYDNDGWLDVIAYGNSLRVWRNLGRAGFEDVTAAIGLDKVGPIDSVAAADFDGDCDTDLVLSSSTGLQFWRNDGGNANHQIKLLLVGNRSNPSALGVRVEVLAGRWRTIRTLERLPFEIGIGKHDKIDVLKTRWFDLATTLVDLPVQCPPLTLAELALPTGSCPYLYAWDGQTFRFVTDILGSSPLGLPVSETHYVEADPEEFLSLGNETDFPPKDGKYELRITEELREVLYLDQARLMVVDHAPATVVQPTSKMVPGKPFPPHELWTLRPLAAVRKATRSDGLDVTAALAATDGRRVSPVRLREPQLRGLAEPFSITLDFGDLPTAKPLVLVLNGWLRFGGGMANIAASLDPNLPFPFPALEAELPDGSWKPVPVVVGVPAGKTKTILMDLDGKLPTAARRLRLSMAFELYWDSALLCEKSGKEQTRITGLSVDHADLHWRGFSQFAAPCDTVPLTPDYNRIEPAPPWRRTPSGWCTRYGQVDDLITNKDNALVLLNGGDELALSFRADRLPPKPDGFVREFFLYVVGWDKDADFHVGQGWRVEPLPFLGMDDQAYDHQTRPGYLDESWMAKYNTRWVGPMVLTPVSSHGVAVQSH